MQRVVCIQGAGGQLGSTDIICDRAIGRAVIIHQGIGRRTTRVAAGNIHFEGGGTVFANGRSARERKRGGGNLSNGNRDVIREVVTGNPVRGFYSKYIGVAVGSSTHRGEYRIGNIQRIQQDSGRYKCRHGLRTAHVFPFVRISTVSAGGGSGQGKTRTGADIRLISARNACGSNYRRVDRYRLRLRGAGTTGAGRHLVTYFCVSGMIGGEIGRLIRRRRKNTERISRTKLIDRPLAGITRRRARNISNGITLTHLGGWDGDRRLRRGTNGDSLRGGVRTATSVCDRDRNRHGTHRDVINVGRGRIRRSNGYPTAACAPGITRRGKTTTVGGHAQHALGVRAISRRGGDINRNGSRAGTQSFARISLRITSFG